jgi:hypothetical protein
MRLLAQLKTVAVTETKERMGSDETSSPVAAHKGAQPRQVVMRRTSGFYRQIHYQ